MEVEMTLLHRNKAALMIVTALLASISVLALAQYTRINSQVAWVKDFDAALKQAASEKKFIILDISASW